MHVLLVEDSAGLPPHIQGTSPGERYTYLSSCLNRDELIIDLPGLRAELGR